ncbi:MAG: 50S ribosomal protein L4 [bacterium]|nr:50S ribosomal protein L4 [bacterium]
MNTLKVYNQEGNVTGDLSAPAFLSLPSNVALMHQVFKSIAANLRKPVAHTKNRSEVSGGGIKPWKQKGTGRARHGSIRSPLWRHGGVTHGPRNTTDFSQKINKKMAKKALQLALGEKFKADQLMVVNDLLPKEMKTKFLARTVKNLIGDKSALLVVSQEDKNLLRSSKNLPNAKTIFVKDLNVYEVLNHKYILMDKKAMESFK